MQNWIASNYDIIINLILALSAITASIFAGITIRQAKEFRKRDEFNNRAIINQSPPVGFLLYSPDYKDDQVCLEINFENIGNHPAYEIKTSVLYISHEIIDGLTELPGTIPTSNFPSFNPIPPKGKYRIAMIKRKLCDIGLDEERIKETKYIIVRVYYKDQILEQSYSSIFYWFINDDGKLIEIFEKDYEKLKILGKILE